MKFSRLAAFFGQIEATSLRNAKTVILADVLKEAELEEVDKLVYLALGGLRPQFDRLEFNLAEKMILRAIAQSAGKLASEIESEYQKIGDLGELMVSLASGSTSELSVSAVYEQLTKIAQDAGSGSQERKVTGLSKLVKVVDSPSAKYIIRMVAGKLRLGFSDKTVIDALSYLEHGTKEFSTSLETAYQMRPDPGFLARRVKEVGVTRAIETMNVEMGTPIVPALAQRLKTASDMIEKMGTVLVEPKFDGTRVQIHFSRKMESQSSDHSPKITQGSELGIQASMFAAEEEKKPAFWVRTFTRNLDESSAMFPELQKVAEHIKADEVILDSEAVGYDPKTGKLVPFQMTITRKRKHGIEEASGSVPLKFFVFDIMYLNGKSLIGLPLHERRKILRDTISEGEILQIDESIETDDPAILRNYHRQQLDAGLEGALVKQIDGAYMPGRTGFNWVKFKEAEDSRAKLADTIDVAIMGYYLGKGKRSTFGLGAFLVGVRSGEHVVTLAKVGTGITDEIFKELRIRLEKIKTEKIPEGYSVPKVLEPDVWVEPRVVVEVAADEITISPTHSAGYALRFPRLVKFRDDKGLDQITSLEEVKTMFELIG
jgi:DNA ligase-1